MAISAARGGVTRGSTVARSGLAMLLATIFACSGFSTSGLDRSDRESSARVRVAVAPVTLTPELQRQYEEDPSRFADVATHLGHDLSEVLEERGADVVTAHDSGGVLGELSRSPEFHRDASRLARAAAARLHIDALLVVEVTRWSPREEERGVPSRAAVGFRATLHGGSSGRLLWSSEFSERQASFLENPWRALQYPGRGTRWLSAIELARWGSRRLGSEVPLSRIGR